MQERIRKKRSIPWPLLPQSTDLGKEVEINKGNQLKWFVHCRLYNNIIKFSTKASPPRAIFHPKFTRLKDVFYATFSRDKSHFFDSTHEWYFDKSTRERIVDFLLKRKRFSDNDQDDFAFGITRLIKLGVYSDAYPVHDGSLENESKATDTVHIVGVCGSDSLWHKKWQRSLMHR